MTALIHIWNGMPAHPEFPALIHALGWTLLHFCWQGAAIAALLWCMLVLLPMRMPQLRYVAASLALAMMVALPVATFVRLARAEIRASRELRGLPIVMETVVVDAGADAAPEPLRQRVGRALDDSVPWLPAVWLAGVVVFLVRLNLGMMVARRMRSAVMEPAQDGLRESFARLRERLGVTRTVRLMQSAMVQAPTVIGWLRPVVLIPVGCLTGLSTAQIEAILAHELAHIRRHDYLVNVMQSVVEALLFYHPAVWWVSKQMRRERESCCDDVAVKLSGDRVAYARALSWLEEHRAATPELVLGANGGALKMRIRRLLGLKESAAVSRGVAITLLSAVVAAAIWYAGAIAHAQSSQAQTGSATAASTLAAPPPAAVPSNSAAVPSPHATHKVSPGEQRRTLEGDSNFQALSPEAQQQIRDGLSRLDAMSPEMERRMNEVEQQAQDAAARLNSPEFKKQMADAMTAVARVNSPEARKQFEGAMRAAKSANDARSQQLIAKLNSLEFQKRITDAEAAAARVDAAELQKKLGDAMKAIDNASNFQVKGQPYQFLAQSNEAAAPPAASAGQGDGAISGTIVDPTGALVPRAQVTVVNTDSGWRMVKQTDNTGKYSLSPLPAGPYNVEVEAKGFQRLLQENVQVAAGKQAELDMRLSVGAGNTTVSVTGAPVAAAPVPQPFKVSPKPSSGPERVSAGVLAGNLISRPDPVYPEEAKAAHVEGAVILRAVISKDGSIKTLTYISGPPQLVVSAIDAVEKWKYKPYLLNGEPTEVVTTITVNYSFEGSTENQAQPGDHKNMSEAPKKIGGDVTAPVLAHSVPPEYSAEARKAKASGKVVVGLWVNELGQPTHVHLVHGVGFGLDQKAVDAVKEYKFKSALEDGKPVLVAMNVEVNFKIF
jgi:TonB family protein